MDRRPHPRPLRPGAGRSLRAGRQAHLRRVPRAAAHQRGLRRHALPGHRGAARPPRNAQAPRPGHLRPELPPDRAGAGHSPVEALPRPEDRARQQHPSPGREGHRARLRHRGLEPARPRARGHPPPARPGPQLHRRDPVAPRIPQVRQHRDGRRHAHSPRLPVGLRHRPRGAAHEHHARDAGANPQPRRAPVATGAAAALKSRRYRVFSARPRAPGPPGRWCRRRCRSRGPSRGRSGSTGRPPRLRRSRSTASGRPAPAAPAAA